MSVPDLQCPECLEYVTLESLALDSYTQCCNKLPDEVDPEPDFHYERCDYFRHPDGVWTAGAWKKSYWSQLVPLRQAKIEREYQKFMNLHVSLSITTNDSAAWDVMRRAVLAAGFNVKLAEGDKPGERCPACQGWRRVPVVGKAYSECPPCGPCGGSGLVSL